MALKIQPAAYTPPFGAANAAVNAAEPLLGPTTWRRQARSPEAALAVGMMVRNAMTAQTARQANPAARGTDAVRTR